MIKTRQNCLDKTLAIKSHKISFPEAIESQGNCQAGEDACCEK